MSEIVAYAEKESWSCDGPGVLRTEWRVRTVASFPEGVLDARWGTSWHRQDKYARRGPTHVLEQRYIRCGKDEGWVPFDAYSSREAALEDVNSDAVSLDSKLDEIRARWQAANEASKAAEEEKRQAGYRAERARASEKAFQQMQQSPRGKALADQWNGFVAAHANAADKARLEADSEFMSRYRAMLDATQISVKTKALKELFRYVKSQELGGLPSRSTDMPKAQYEVIVGNIGTVYSGTNHREASSTFASYVQESKSAYGRAGGEDVTLMKNGEPEREYLGARRDVAMAGDQPNERWINGDDGRDDELSGFKSSHARKRAARVEPDPKTFLSVSEGQFRVIEQGQPIFADKANAREALAVAERFKLKVADRAWNGDKGIWVPLASVTGGGTLGSFGRGTPVLRLENAPYGGKLKAASTADSDLMARILSTPDTPVRIRRARSIEHKDYDHLLKMAGQFGYAVEAPLDSMDDTPYRSGTLSGLPQRHYWYVHIPYTTKNRTAWHLTERTGFSSPKEAHAWAQKHLRGSKYAVRQTSHPAELGGYRGEFPVDSASGMDAAAQEILIANMRAGRNPASCAAAKQSLKDATSDLKACERRYGKRECADQREAVQDAKAESKVCRRKS